MRQRLLARVAALSILSMGVSVTGPVFAQSAPAGEGAAASPPTEAATKEARDHYEAGLALYSDGEFQRAAIEFDRAYELVPNYRALYNIGQVRIQLHNYARAMKALQAYLKEGGSKIDAERKKSVNDDLEMLSTRTALLTIETNEAGAEIVVDGEVAGTAPLPEPLLLDTGDHRIGVRKAGFVPRENSITLASRDSLSMRIDIQKEELSKPVVVVAPTTAAADRTAWIWGTWSATAALAVGAGVTGGLGIKAANELDDKRSTLGSTRDELDSAQSRAKTLLNTSTVLGVGAVVTGTIALYLTLSKPSGPDKSKKRAGLRIGPTSVDLVGQF
jgi:tetratricopeptide (TPR) repeat protein